MSDPVLAAILRDADAEYERRYGTAWVNPKAARVSEAVVSVKLAEGVVGES